MIYIPCLQIQVTAADSSAQAVQHVNIQAFYLGHSGRTDSIQKAIKGSAAAFTQSDNPAQFKAVGSGVLYVDKAWYDSQGASARASVANPLSAVLARGIPVVEVAPSESQNSQMASGVVSGLGVIPVSFSINGSSVSPSIMGYGLKVFPPDAATHSPSAQAVWASDTGNLTKDATWFASDSLQWALNQMPESVPQLTQAQASAVTVAGANDTSCSQKVSADDYTPQKLLAKGDPCPATGLSQSFAGSIYAPWNLCSTNGGLGILTVLNDALYYVTNSGSSSYHFSNWYLQTNEVPGHLKGACTSGGTNWYGADLQEYINWPSGIQVFCYGPGTTTGTSTAGVDVGFNAGSDGAGITAGYSYSYSISDAPVYDQSVVSNGYLNWWTNLNEAGSSGAYTFNSEPAADFARPASSSTPLTSIWHEAQWMAPGWCLFGGWSCLNARLSESSSGYYRITIGSPPL